ncbi:MAG: hypothetical protein A2Z21_01195 [Candidatus Fraserbacteria bacterium RBG_16_55_9]|uniref:Uncharacterized protein n=1 Tax=Fraserbacteria sp. (strain RBG_16_55_9) TaxID=1817864 RepID=A0A1F5UQ79_FRAXR|nr:MAG: hypothetical protein A2Z21_01195 [Candidatus Fraserbacteria bacterium RBG_16_55_9]
MEEVKRHDLTDQPIRHLAEVEMSEADKANLQEVNLNRRAIVALGKISLDHEQRLLSLEEAVGALAGEEEELVEIEAETDGEDQ